MGDSLSHLDDLLSCDYCTIDHLSFQVHGLFLSFLSGYFSIFLKQGFHITKTNKKK